jgi:hypothetical protein
MGTGGRSIIGIPIPKDVPRGAGGAVVHVALVRKDARDRVDGPEVLVRPVLHDATRQHRLAIRVRRGMRRAPEPSARCAIDTAAEFLTKAREGTP